MKLSRPSLALAVAHSAAVAPSTALAQGGGGGGSTPPPSAPDAVCDSSGDGWTADGYLSTGPIKDAACVTTLQTDTALRLLNVTPEPGWTYTVTSNGDGTNSRIEVKFENPTTGERVEWRMEFGKTVIK